MYFKICIDIAIALLYDMFVGRANSPRTNLEDIMKLVRYEISGGCSNNEWTIQHSMTESEIISAIAAEHEVDESDVSITAIIDQD